MAGTELSSVEKAEEEQNDASEKLVVNWRKWRRLNELIMPIIQWKGSAKM